MVGYMLCAPNLRGTNVRWIFQYLQPFLDTYCGLDSQVLLFWASYVLQPFAHSCLLFLNNGCLCVSWNNLSVNYNSFFNKNVSKRSFKHLDVSKVTFLLSRQATIWVLVNKIEKQILQHFDVLCNEWSCWYAHKVGAFFKLLVEIPFRCERMRWASSSMGSLEHTFIRQVLWVSNIDVAG